MADMHTAIDKVRALAPGAYSTPWSNNDAGRIDGWHVRSITGGILGKGREEHEAWEDALHHLEESR